MNSKSRALEYFENLVADKKLVVSNNLFDAATRLLQAEAAENGLTEEEINICADVILYKKLSSTKCQALLKCMVPVTTVCKATTSIMQWIFTYHKTVGVQSVITALSWITGLLDFGLTDEKRVDGFYHMFFFLLGRINLEPIVCKLIYILTKPEDVTRWRVTSIFKLHTKNGGKKHTSALLNLFKSYKPECVPESVPAMNIHFAFKNISKQMIERFQQAQARKQALGIEPEDWVKDLMWKTATSRTNGAKKSKVELIPMINYIHFGSALYHGDEKRSLLEFNKMETMACHQLNIDIPCNIMSLLENSGGFHILTFGSTELQSRFSHCLYYTLYNAFIDKIKGVDEKEKEVLLDQVVALEQYMQQGIPVVSRFLGEYLHQWNGLDFRQQIFQLLQWITFSSFTELYDCILDYIRTLFMSSSLNIKCAIIFMLGRMMQNLLIVGSTRQRRHISSMFLNVQEGLNFENAVKSLSNFVVGLCIMGLNLEDGNAVLVDEIFHFCEMAIFWEGKSGLPLWTLMPPGLVYRGLFSRSPLFMARACGLLLKYREYVYPRLKTMGYQTHFKEQQNRAQEYVVDFLNCLWDEEAFHNRKEGYIFKDLPKKPIKFLSGLVLLKKSFDLSEHFALIPLIYYMKTINTDLEFDTTNKMDYLQIVRAYFPEIYDLLYACLNDK